MFRKYLFEIELFLCGLFLSNLFVWRESYSLLIILRASTHQIIKEDVFILSVSLQCVEKVFNPLFQNSFFSLSNSLSNTLLFNSSYFKNKKTFKVWCFSLSKIGRSWESICLSRSVAIVSGAPLSAECSRVLYFIIWLQSVLPWLPLLHGGSTK